MICRESQHLFSAYMDDELSGEERMALEEHLVECASCSEEMDAWRTSSEALVHTLDHMAVPSTSLEEFLSAVTSDSADDGVIGRIVAYLSAPRRAIAATIGGSLAITAVLLALVWVSIPSSSTPRQQPRIESPLQQYQLMIGQADIQEEGALSHGI